MPIEAAPKGAGTFTNCRLLVDRSGKIYAADPSAIRVLQHGNEPVIGELLSQFFSSEKNIDREISHLFASDPTTLNQIPIHARLTCPNESRTRPATGGAAPDETEPAEVPATEIPLTLVFDSFSNTADGEGLLLVSVAEASSLVGSEVERIAAVFDGNPSPVIRADGSGRITYANPGSWILLEHWGVAVGDPLPEEWRSRISGMIDNGESFESEISIGFKVIHLVGVPVPELGYVSLYGMDVTDRKRLEEKLVLGSQVVENASEGVIITDPEFRVLEVNRAFTDITGFTAGDILGETAIPLLSGRQGEEGFRRIWSTVDHSGSWQGELWDRRKNGDVYPKWLSISAVRDDSGILTNYTILFADISKIKEAEESLYRLAHYDSLTGLANRRFFRDRLHSAITRARRNAASLGLAFVDIDGFKMVNDNLGHRAGDELLRVIGARLQHSVRETDMVSRIGGDEFTVILPDLRSAADAAPVAEKILDRIAEPVILEGEELTMSASIGVAIFPDDGSEADELLQNADSAMYRIKQSGKNNFQFYSREMNNNATTRLSLRTKLKRAIERNALTVHYQPQVTLDARAMVALEALCRWPIDGNQMIPPGVFIPVAEESGLIEDLGELVLRKVCEQWGQWNGTIPEVPRICVNVSALQLRVPDFSTRLRDILERADVPPSSLEFEITESLFVEDSGTILRKLNEIRELGATLAIDDFGTRYSSLGYLRRLPIDRIKIDKSFLRETPEDSRNAEITAAILAMGHSMHFEVIGEGVEREEQVAFLRQLGCDLIQGNLVSPARSAEDLREMLYHLRDSGKGNASE